jgi:2'-phosphotransferase
MKIKVFSPDAIRDKSRSDLPLHLESKTSGSPSPFGFYSGAAAITGAPIGRVELKEGIKIGKKLCFILRHNMIDSGLTCDCNGYVKVTDLISKKLIEPISLTDLIYIVESNDKQRFSLIKRFDEYYIKANQGHSLEVGNLIESGSLELLIEPLSYCAHGTEKKFIESISMNGLNRMLRKHIHFVGETIEKNSTPRSGFKKKSDTIILIDMERCMQDGILFYRSENNVILTEGIDGVIHPKYFLNVL